MLRAAQLSRFADEGEFAALRDYAKAITAVRFQNMSEVCDKRFFSQALIDDEADIKNPLAYELTPLQEAARVGKLEKVEVSTRRTRFVTLHILCTQELLDSSADVDAVGEFGSTALHLASSYVKLLRLGIAPSPSSPLWMRRKRYLVEW